MTEIRACAQCGVEMAVLGKGRPKIFCSSRCKARKYRSEFSSDKKLEKLQYNKEYYRRNSEHLKARQRDWNAANREHIRDRDAAYYIRNAGYIKARQRRWLKNLKATRPNDYAAHIRDQVRRWRIRNAIRVIANTMIERVINDEIK